MVGFYFYLGKKLFLWLMPGVLLHFPDAPQVPKSPPLNPAPGPASLTYLFFLSRGKRKRRRFHWIRRGSTQIGISRGFEFWRAHEQTSRSGALPVPPGRT